MNNTTSIVVGVAGVLAVIVVVGAIIVSLGSSVDPHTLLVQSVHTTTDAITIQLTPTASAIQFRNYTVEAKDGALYVTIVGSYTSLFAKEWPGTISIPNTYGTLSAIYLKGQGHEEDVMIWPENMTMAHTPPTE